MKHQWTDSLQRPIDCIHREQRQLVGLTHPNKRGLDRLTLWRGLVRGMPLVLVPDPDNPVDRNAILIYRADDLENDLGYMEYHGAKRICPLIERGATFTADVMWIDNKSELYPKVYMFVYQMTEPIRAKRPTRRHAHQYPSREEVSIDTICQSPTPDVHEVASEPEPIPVSFPEQGMMRFIERIRSYLGI